MCVPVHTRLAGICLVLLAFQSGCAGASPRFTGARVPADDSTRIVADTTGLSPEDRSEISEEIRENDKTLDVNSIVLTIASLPPDHPAFEHRKVIDEILSMIGTPYSYSGTDSLGIDCSGFTARVYRNALNLDLPHSSREQYRMGTKVAPGQKKIGDLLFFKTRRSGPSHVGIYIGEDLFAHASVSEGVTISSLQSSYYRKRYLGARRIVE
jgi:cell wall-associated NlpC family hydrolase